MTDIAALDPPTRARILNARYSHLDGADLLRVMLRDVFPGRIAAVSSFGADSAVLLDLVATVDPATPVIFLDSGKHFGETLRYRETLTRELGLWDVRTEYPDEAEVRGEDAKGMLWRSDPDACCHLRKVRPLAQALEGFDAWITGRKRFQGGGRSQLAPIEEADGLVKVNPLARWTAEDVRGWARTRNLPAHPLTADGFLSIGCMPCTERVAPGEDSRAGRWRGSAKTECGIHTRQVIVQ